MPNKGTTKSCCCVGCDSPPMMAGEGSGGTLEKGDPNPQIVQTACLACMPLQICLSAYCAGFNEPALLQRQDPCGPYPDITMSYWSGIVSLGNSVATFTVFFDIVDGACYLCISCDALGITGEEAGSRILHHRRRARLIFAVMSGLSGSALPQRPGHMDSESARGDVHHHGDPGQQHVSLQGTPACPDCPRSVRRPGKLRSRSRPELLFLHRLRLCVQPGLHHDYEIDAPVVQQAKSRSAISLWRTPGGTLIVIHPNLYTNECELWLDSLEGLDDGDSWSESFASVPIANRCPDVSASWNIMSTKGVFFSVNLTCAQCGTCEELTTVGCCPQPLPNLLYATVDTGVCNCGQIVIPLFAMPGIPGNYWEGCSGWTECCGHNLCLRVICNGDGTWSMGFDEGVGTAGGGASFNSLSPYQTTDYASCEPLQVKFINVTGGAASPCRTNPQNGIHINYTITVTE